MNIRQQLRDHLRLVRNPIATTILVAVFSAQSIAHAPPAAPLVQQPTDALSADTIRSLSVEAKSWFVAADGSVWTSKRLDIRNDVFRRLLVMKSPSTEIRKQAEALRQSKVALWICPARNLEAESAIDVVRLTDGDVDDRVAAILRAEERFSVLGREERLYPPGKPFGGTRARLISRSDRRGGGDRTVVFYEAAVRLDRNDVRNETTVTLQLCLAGKDEAPCILYLSYTYSGTIQINPIYSFETSVQFADVIGSVRSACLISAEQMLTVTMANEVNEIRAESTGLIERKGAAITAASLLDWIEGRNSALGFSSDERPARSPEFSVTLTYSQVEAVRLFLATALNALNRVQAGDGPRLPGLRPIVANELAEHIRAGTATFERVRLVVGPRQSASFEHKAFDLPGLRVEKPEQP